MTAPVLTGAALAAVAAVSPQSSGIAQAAAATPISHIVVIYQENNSFDETLGSYCRARAVPCDSGYTGRATLAGGTQVALHHAPDIVPQAAHTVTSQLTAVDGGKMDGWASISACAAPYYRCLGYYARSDIPNLATLADHFTVSNRTFSMTNSPSWGGHLYAAAATLDGFIGGNSYPAKGVAAGPGWGCDSNKLAGWRAPNGSVMTVPSCIPAADGSGPFRPSPVRHVPTIFDRLSGAGYSWKIYGQTKVNTTAGTPYGWSICPSFADCLYTRQVHRLVPSVDVLTDAARGHLPAYSVVTPSLSSSRLIGTSTSQHNGSSMKAGDNWIGKVVSAIEKGPNWRSTAIFITYDDCGCFYDHVSPPRNPDGSREGIRVPMVIVSPYAKRGGLDSNNATFASILAYTEHNFGLKPLAANDRNAYNYAKAFNYNQTPLKGVALKTRPIPRSSLQYLRTHPSPDDDDT